MVKSKRFIYSGYKNIAKKAKMNSEISLNENRRYLHPAQGVDLEVVEFSQDPNLPPLVIYVGLGGMARLDR